MTPGRVVAVTGTDTGVGKTVTTAAVASVAASTGSVAVYKPVQTGADIGDSDVDEIRRLSGVDDVHVGFTLPEPLAPVAAARRADLPLPTIDDHIEAIQKLAASHDTVLVEGAGGVLVALTGEGEGVAELALAVGAGVLVVARAGLGTLNHTALTVEALRARGCRTVGAVIGAWPAEPDLAAQCNVRDLPAIAGVAVLGRIPEGVAGLSTAEFCRGAPAWIDTSGWLT